ncbi:MAG: hypothetical protein HRU38_09220 [Saccharospirillaceae bacterium]|nr:hypothetical protein [Pseudomonadales bacterium]NRB78835.1 hypothetical protein [Saccharospirillaceae bacterium]
MKISYVLSSILLVVCLFFILPFVFSWDKEFNTDQVMDQKSKSQADYNLSEPISLEIELSNNSTDNIDLNNNSVKSPPEKTLARSPNFIESESELETEVKTEIDESLQYPDKTAQYYSTPPSENTAIKTLVDNDKTISVLKFTNELVVGLPVSYQNADEVVIEEVLKEFNYRLEDNDLIYSDKDPDYQYSYIDEVHDLKLKSCLKKVTSENLKNLSCKGVYNLSGIESFTSLESVFLTDFKGRDLTPLSALSHLKSLLIMGFNVVDLGSINSNSLKFLDLWDGRIENYSSLMNINNIDFLMLSNINKDEFFPINQLDKLKTLFISNMLFKGDEVQKIGRLKNIEYLSLMYTNIKNIEFVNRLKTLKSLYIEGSIVESIPLFDQMNIKDLTISNSKLSNIDNIYTLSELKYVDLSNNAIVEMSGLYPLYGLRILHLYNNKIENIYGIDNMKGLIDLTVVNNPIVDCEPIKLLGNLQGIVDC